jgi:hypothetical protein
MLIESSLQVLSKELGQLLHGEIGFGNRSFTVGYIISQMLDSIKRPKVSVGLIRKESERENCKLASGG